MAGSSPQVTSCLVTYSESTADKPPSGTSRAQGSPALAVKAPWLPMHL